MVWDWVLKWCQVTVDDLTGMQQQQHSVSGPTARARRAHSQTHMMPSGLLMVHAVLTVGVKVLLCGMTRI